MTFDMAQRKRKEDNGSNSKEGLQGSTNLMTTRGKKWNDLSEEEDEQDEPEPLSKVASQNSGETIVPETQDKDTNVQPHSLGHGIVYWDKENEIFVHASGMDMI